MHLVYLLRIFFTMRSFMKQKWREGRNGPLLFKYMENAWYWVREALLNPCWLHLIYFVGISILGFQVPSSSSVPDQKPKIPEPAGCFLYFCIGHNSNKPWSSENARILRVPASCSHNIDASRWGSLHFHSPCPSQKTFIASFSNE